jgi:nucleotide-binding universal stress UspA family protein
MRTGYWPASTSPVRGLRRRCRGLGGAAHGAPLELLHIIDRQARPPSAEDHSGTIGFDAQEKLLDKLSSAEDEQRTRGARERGRQFLTRLRERAGGQRRRRGGYPPALWRARGNAAGAGSRRAPARTWPPRPQSAETTQRDLGRNVERVVRALHRPILAVTAGFEEPQRVMFAFDGGAITRRGVEVVAASPLFRDLPILLFMSGKASSDAQKKLDWAQKKLDAAGLKVEAELVPGDAETVIASTVREREIDFLIMGAFGHSPLRSLLFGSKTADLLRWDDQMKKIRVPRNGGSENERPWLRSSAG